MFEFHTRYSFGTGVELDGLINPSCLTSDSGGKLAERYSALRTEAIRYVIRLSIRLPRFPQAGATEVQYIDIRNFFAISVA